jgi:CheY-like chemotaxis protein
VALASKLSDMLDAPDGGRVLLVEDEPLVQMLAVDFLEELGFRVESAGSATEAINRARLINGQIDYAIVDLGLPDRRGDVLVSELRVLYPHLPIIIASGYDDKATRDRFRGDQGVSFVRKPYAREDLEEALGAARRRTRDPT